MSKHTLSILFGSKARVKLLKFIFQNQQDSFTLKMAASRIQEPKDVVKEEIGILVDIGLIKPHMSPLENSSSKKDNNENS